MVTNVTRTRFNVTLMRKLPVLIFGYVVQYLVDFLWFINDVSSNSDTVPSKDLIIDNKRRGEKGPWATSRFITSRHVFGEKEEKYKNQS
jgi:hypothetical protein